MANYLVLTGGSSGIGKETLSIFQDQDWKLINISRRDSPVPGVINFNIDLADPKWPEQYTNDLLKMIQHADKICLVHNAASFQADDVLSVPEEQLRQVLEINLVSAVSLNKIIIPEMRPGSSIIYIGSTLSEQAVSGRASYVISKHAVIGLMRATCQDLRGQSITTCCICPGFTDTPMLTDNIDSRDKDALFNFIKQKVTAGRLIDPKEIAELIYFCANSHVINGAVLHANLGQVTT